VAVATDDSSGAGSQGALQDAIVGRVFLDPGYFLVAIGTRSFIITFSCPLGSSPWGIK